MDTKEKIAIFNAEKVTTIHFEAPEKFAESISFEEYKKAFSMTKEIVGAQIEENDSVAEGKGTQRRNLEQVYNIISFAGPRGTGKTSVMLSYMEFLKDYYRNLAKDNMKPEEMYDKKLNVMFTGLEFIDVSLLNEDEDILGSVLSKMLGKWQDEEERSRGNSGILRTNGYDYHKRQLYKKFGEVRSCLAVLKKAKEVLNEDDEMVIDSLHKLSMSYNLKKSFQELVSDYLDIMKYPGAGHNIQKHFLVISIDDLDMNIQNGYRLLEEIRKYLMVPNILVLMTVDMEQLEKICLKRYNEEFKNFPKYDEIYINQLTREYLNKIMPEHRRITLKSGPEWKFFSNRVLKVTGKKNISFEKKGTVKDFTKKDFDRLFGMFFGIDSICLDYLTSDTIREFGEWIENIQSLDGLEESKDSMVERYQWFWNEKFQSTCKKYLPYNYIDNFKFALSLSAKEQIRYLKKILINIDNKKSDIRIQGDKSLYYKEKFDHLGTILELLSLFENDSPGNRDLVNMIKIFLTACLAEKMGMEGFKTDKKVFLDYYGYSIWENWERKMVSPILEEKDSQLQAISIGRSSYDGTIGKSVLELACDGYDLLCWSDIVKILTEEKNYKKIVDFQYVLLFHSKLEKNNEIIWKVIKKSNALVLELDPECSGLFSLSSFVMNCYEGASIIQEFIDKVVDELFNESDKKLWDTGCIPPDRLKRVLSILNESETEDKSEYGALLEYKGMLKSGLLLPLNNVEFVTATGKKIQEQLRMQSYVNEKTELTAEGKKCVVKKAVVCFFDILGTSLKELDSDYQGKAYAKEFEKNSLVQRIEKNEEFMDMLAQNIINNAQSYFVLTNENEWGDDV